MTLDELRNGRERQSRTPGVRRHALRSRRRRSARSGGARQDAGNAGSRGEHVGRGARARSPARAVAARPRKARSAARGPHVAGPLRHRRHARQRSSTARTSCACCACSTRAAAARRAAGAVRAGAREPLLHHRPAARPIVRRPRRRGRLRRLHRRLRHADERGSLRRSRVLRRRARPALRAHGLGAQRRSQRSTSSATASAARCRCSTPRCTPTGRSARAADDHRRRRRRGRHRLGRAPDGAGGRVLRQPAAGAGRRGQELVRDARAGLEQRRWAASAISGTGSTIRPSACATCARWRPGSTTSCRRRAGCSPSSISSSARAGTD